MSFVLKKDLPFAKAGDYVDQIETIGFGDNQAVRVIINDTVFQMPQKDFDKWFDKTPHATNPREFLIGVNLFTGQLTALETILSPSDKDPRDLENNYYIKVREIKE